MSHTLYFYNDTDRYIGVTDKEDSLFSQLPDKLNCNKMSCKISLNIPTNTYGMSDCEYILVKDGENYILYEFSVGMELSIGDPCVTCYRHLLPPQKMTKVNMALTSIQNVVHKEFAITGNEGIERWCKETYGKVWSDLRLIDQRSLRDIYNDREKIMTEVPGHNPSIVDIWAYKRAICYLIEKGKKRRVELSEIIKLYGSLNFLYTKYNAVNKYIVSTWWKKAEKVPKKKLCPVHLFSSKSFINRYDIAECMVCGHIIPILTDDEEVPPDCICHIRYNRDSFYILHV